MALVPISDLNELNQVRHLRDDLVEGSAHFNERWIRGHAWQVVPVESASHFDRNYAQLLSKAFNLLECPVAFAIATENVGPGWPDLVRDAPVEAFLVDTSMGGLLDFNRACSLFNFALIPADRRCAVLCTVYDYYLVAGPTEFVSTAVGGDISQALRRFDECADDPVWRGRLLKVARRYRDIKTELS